MLRASQFVDSPFNEARPVFLREDRIWASQYNPPIFDTSDPDYTSLLYTVLPGDTLQSIAVKFYGDSGKWYWIAEMNKILNPFKEVTDGMILVIPQN